MRITKKRSPRLILQSLVKNGYPYIIICIWCVLSGGCVQNKSQDSLKTLKTEIRVNSGLPALFGVKANTGKAFESEREILYQVLFDMRRDVTDLKKLVNTLMAERGAQSVPTAPATTAVSYYQEPQRNLVATVVPATPTIISAAKPAHPVVDDIQDTEEVVEEATLSLDEVEKEMIRKALDRHHGKRKNAAKDLNISERTLYRKIKEYGLD